MASVRVTFLATLSALMRAQSDLAEGSSPPVFSSALEGLLTDELELYQLLGFCDTPADFRAPAVRLTDELGPSETRGGLFSTSRECLRGLMRSFRGRIKPPNSSATADAHENPCRPAQMPPTSGPTLNARPLIR